MCQLRYAVIDMCPTFKLGHVPKGEPVGNRRDNTTSNNDCIDNLGYSVQYRGKS